MPFTLSHTAAVLPLLKNQRLSATGLVVGAMVPDFEYFLRMNVKGIYGHTLWGILYFDVPMSIALAFLFHLVAKRNLIDNLPVFLQRRFSPARHLDFVAYFKKHYVAFCISAIIGAISHIVWDGFTHQHQYFVQALPSIYEGRVFEINGAKYPLWYVLQHISTIVGGALVAWYAWKMPVDNGEFPKPRFGYWVALGVLVGAITFIRMQFPFENLANVVLVITLISSFCIGITILGLVKR